MARELLNRRIGSFKLCLFRYLFKTTTQEKMGTCEWQMSYQMKRQCGNQCTDCHRWRMSAIKKRMQIRISLIREEKMLRL